MKKNDMHFCEKSRSTFYQKSRVFSLGCGFLPQWMLTGWFWVGLSPKLILPPLLCARCDQRRVSKVPVGVHVLGKLLTLSGLSCFLRNSAWLQVGMISTSQLTPHLKSTTPSTLAGDQTWIRWHLLQFITYCSLLRRSKCI
jgi:hypothetical protein